MQFGEQDNIEVVDKTMISGGIKFVLTN